MCWCPSGLFLFFSLCAGIWAHRQDKADKLKAAEEGDEEDEEEEEAEDEEDKDKDAEGDDEDDEGVSEAVVVSKDEASRIRRLMRQSLPTFARVRNYWALLCTVLKDKHDW